MSASAKLFMVNGSRKTHHFSGVVLASLLSYACQSESGAGSKDEATVSSAFPAVPSDGVCPAIIRATLSIRVTDAATEQEICDADLVATDGAGKALKLIREPGRQSCYFGAYEGREATFNVSAHKEGYVDELRSVRMKQLDPCRFEAPAVHFALRTVH